MTSVVAPTKEVDPGPYVSGNLWMSFWEHVEVRRTPLEAPEIGRALRALHDALAEYPGAVAAAVRCPGRDRLALECSLG